MGNHPKDTEPLPHYRVTSSDPVSASNLIAAIATAVFYEGMKALVARARLGLPEPKVEGKPLSRFFNTRLLTGTDMQALAMYFGRRVGLGSLWIHHNLKDAPADVPKSDSEAVAALRRALGEDEE